MTPTDPTPTADDARETVAADRQEPTPADEAPGSAQQTDQPVGGDLDGHPGEPAQPGVQDPRAENVEPSQPTEGLGSRTPDETVDGQPATQQGQETGPAAGPSPDAGGQTQP